MKKKEIEYILKLNGYYLLRESKHIIYTDGENTVALPRKAEYSRGLCRRIMQQAKLEKEYIKEII